MLNFCIIVIPMLSVNAMCPDCEPRRTSVKKAKRLSQKSRKRRVFVWKRILKIATLS